MASTGTPIYIDMLRKVFVRAEKMAANVELFEREISKGLLITRDGRPPKLTSYDYYFKNFLDQIGVPWDYGLVRNLYEIAAPLCHMILEEKAIPSNRIKTFEAAYKLVTRKNKITSQAKWLVQAVKVLPVLLEANEWPEAQEATIEIKNVTVVNQTKHEVENMERLIQAAAERISNSQVKGTDRVLDSSVVWILSDMNRRRNVLADYVPSKDLIRLYYTKRLAGGELNALIHEWGHRLWEKFLDKETKLEWVKHHNQVSRNSSGVAELPKVGERLDFVKGKPTVAKIEGGKVWFDEQRYVNARTILDFLGKFAAFPTTYAATNYEEHFCEAFALYCEGKLGAPHREAFERICVKGLNETLRRKPRSLVNIVWG
jgi:hypothetical protein